MGSPPPPPGQPPYGPPPGGGYGQQPPYGNPQQPYGGGPGFSPPPGGGYGQQPPQQPPGGYGYGGGPGGYGSPNPVPPNRNRLIGLVVGGLVLVIIAVVGVVLAVGTGKDKDKDNKANSASPSPNSSDPFAGGGGGGTGKPTNKPSPTTTRTTPPPTPTQTKAVTAGKFDLTAPDTIGDLKKMDESAAVKQVKNDTQQLPNPPYTKQVITGYGPASATAPSYIVTGGAGSILFPELELNSYFKGLEISGSKVTDRKTFDPGPNGGFLECGAFADPSIPSNKISTCIWVSESTFAGVVDFTPSHVGKVDLPTLAQTTLTIRAAMDVKK